MPNTSVFTGADGSVTLSVVGADEVISVGRVQNVQVEVHSDVKAFHEVGQRYATELRPGNVHITGTIERGYIDRLLIKLLLGEEAANKRPEASWAQPTINITLMLKNAANPTATNTITLHEVKIDGWVYTLPEDDFLLEQASFQALYLTVEDAG